MDPGLLTAATEGDHERFRARMREDPGLLAKVSAQGNTLLHVAARLGDKYLLLLVGAQLPGLLAQANKNGDTALHLAARAGNVPIVSSLVARASKDPHLAEDLLMAKNRSGDTALHEAVRNRRECVVGWVMEARPDLASVVNHSGESALYLAAEWPSLAIVKILLDSELAAWDGPGQRTALHAAVHRSYDVAKLLLDRKPEFSGRQDASQSTALHYAASDGDPTMVQLLLGYDASAAYIPDAEGLLPIHVAAAMGHVGVIQELLRACPDSGELVDNRGRNLLHVAVEKKSSDVVRYVLRTPLLKEIVNERDYDGNTALHLATINRSREMVDMLLADKRVNTNIANCKGFTPLDLASSRSQSYVGLRMYKIRQALVSAGSKPSPQRLDHLTGKTQRNHEEETIRCRAIANNLAIVAVLIATVTFAAAFTLPGGYRNDAGPHQGAAALTKKAAFKAFLISDAVAMVCSIVVICLLIHTGSVDHDVRLRSISSSMKLIQVALGGMVAAFAAGVYVVTAAECEWLAFLICAIVCSVPLWVFTRCPSKPSAASIRGRKASTAGGGAKSAGEKGYHISPSYSEERISVPFLMKIMGLDWTIDFRTPAVSGVF